MTTTLDLSAAARPAPASLPSLAGLTFEQLKAALVETGLVDERKAKMRAEQLWRWVYHYGVTSFDEMTNVSKALRNALEERFTMARPQIVERQLSNDGTRKYLIRFAPGVEAETVFIPGVGRSGALCVSSQVGCTLNCTFCHTGTQKLVRNLTAAEIITQVMIARDDLGEWPTSNEDRQITNIVFMGMGEPLYNLDHVSDAIEVIADSHGISIGRRRMTVSTSGVVPKIVELGERTRAMLAISLHATNDALRDELVPINKRYPLAELMDAIRAYPDLSNSKRVTFEYVMLKGVNDSPAEARELVRLLKGIPSKINLIPFNPWPGSGYECSDWDQIETFAEIVNRAGYASPIRTPRGRDILAACGQLKSDSEKMRASERLKLERAAQEASPDSTANTHLYGEGTNLA
ncbi:dual-specificity RNA methyltransferase RlmN [Marinicauda pacifica]|jgi:23S rRNA (adenine2503-C2)-methyltransferase|uniref:Dual-specificity RNA methyltransferase RlmN n=1 Tax=Marinicauda pacifica TaxID=1133559 RepID=A0A4S2H903_9PROT|nr:MULTISPECIES: 23S rRNA (adenine(2503)-C(2))-methyltransferase RlmN [Marinicauda]TGY92327.1 23S rRNA (adenine(2503)-C(2))-methyltransferase RlmN [Marinicauda pacifica]GGE47941.1 dual-specificity RNA methyltransferase RlmN [Marinicauda pacifica]